MANSSLNDLEREVASLIISSLNLEDVTVDDIDPEAALFNEGLGLDSIDALELSMGLSQQYGLKIQASDPDNGRIFASLRNLSDFVKQQRTK